MQPTDILMNEHRLIEQVLNCLEKILEQCTAEKKLDVKSAKQAIEFFRTFADRCHHGKEETRLFPVMQANGFSGGCSPVVVMLREHELGRLYIQGMDAAIDPAAAGDTESLKWFIEHGQSLVEAAQGTHPQGGHLSLSRCQPSPDGEGPRATLGRVSEN